MQSKSDIFWRTYAVTDSVWDELILDSDDDDDDDDEEDDGGGGETEASTEVSEGITGENSMTWRMNASKNASSPMSWLLLITLEL